MMNSEKTRQSIEQEIRVKSLKEAEFRQQLLANPKSAIEAAMGVNIPETLEIEVMEESANHLILTIPPLIAESETELSDKELEAIAGGGRTDVAGGLYTGSNCQVMNHFIPW